MAQKVMVELVDDLDGSAAERTVTFGLDGKTFEIDLNEKNEAKLRKALDPFLAKARRISGGRGRPSARGSRPASADGPTTGELREWAAANGFDVSARGRVSQAIRDAYAAAHS